MVAPSKPINGNTVYDKNAILNQWVPGTLKYNQFFMDVWLNNHFPSKGLESSNWNNHFKVDVSGTR